jgi:hypothetical protein
MQTKGKIFKLVAGTTAAIGIVLLSGCLSTSDRSAGRVLDDKMIGNKVKSALNDSPTYKFDDVKVTTYKGVVQLSGFVDTDEQRRQAEGVAKRVEWVREVVNNISVKPRDEYPTPTGQPTGQRTTDRGSDATVHSSSSAPSSVTTTNNTSIRSTDRSTNP